jgi:hypothetical protein
MARSLKPYGPGTATFSECMTWRWTLSRDLSRYGGQRGILLAIGLNPSTATDADDDPTIHRESKWAIDWGYSAYWKANAYAYRATEPEDMFAARDRGVDIVGPDNDRAIKRLLARLRRDGGLVLAGWGRHIDDARQRQLAALLTGVEVVCCAVNKNGSPAHPLYKKPATLPWVCP